MGEGSGIKTAAELALEARRQEAAGLPSTVSQPALPDLEPEDIGAGPLDAPLDRIADLFSKPRRGRGAGRPKGAVNKMTMAFVETFLATKRHPAYVLADFYSMPLEELAHRLGCTKLEAADFQRKCADTVLPYVAKRLPQAVELTGDNLPTLVLVQPGAMVQQAGSQGAQGEVVDLLATDITPEENQGLSQGDAGAVGTAQLVGGEKDE